MRFILSPGRLCAVILVLLCFNASAQDDSKNIIIQDASEDIRFVKTKEDQPVQVKQSSRTVYACRDYRTSIPVAEFYSDEMQIDNVDIRINDRRKKDIIPKNDYYSVDGVFYSDARICYFPLPFAKKGDIGEVVFDKTILDPRYFNDIYFTGYYDIQRKTISITVPEWLDVEIKEYNFKGFHITSQKEKKSDETVYTYTLVNAKSIKKEHSAPGQSFLAPHLMVLVKDARTRDGEYKYFKTTADQYAWYHALVKRIGNDPAIIKQKAEEITKNKATDQEKVKAIYQWVQQNIRYIAYEDGIAGFKPEKAQEVLRKKYGDCKGMGNLMTQLLRSLGYDARICWVGTNHILYDHSTPSLCVDNHMISAWIHDGKTDFLDGTEKYIGFGELAERIQGREVMIENGESYLLQKIPLATHLQNTSTETRILKVSGSDLTGHVSHVFKGENKEALLEHLDNMKSDRRDEALKKIFSAGNSSYVISNLKTSDLSDYNADLVIEYDLLHKDAFSTFGTEKYLDVDNRKDFADNTIDTTQRKFPLLLPFKDHTVIQVEITLPNSAKINTLPQAINIQNPMYGVSGAWVSKGEKLSYHMETWVDKTWVATSEFQQLNKDVSKIREFYNTQPALSF